MKSIVMDLIIRNIRVTREVMYDKMDKIVNGL